MNLKAQAQCNVINDVIHNGFKLFLKLHLGDMEYLFMRWIEQVLEVYRLSANTTFLDLLHGCCTMTQENKWVFSLIIYYLNTEYSIHRYPNT